MDSVSVPAIAWKVVNVACAAFVATSCVFFVISGGFRGVILGLLGIQLAALIIALEFVPVPLVQTWAPFLFVPFGRGMTMVIMAFVVLDAGWWLYILTLVLNLIVGGYYIAAHFLPQLPQPILSAGMSGVQIEAPGGGISESRLPYADIEGGGGSYNYSGSSPGGTIE